MLKGSQNALCPQLEKSWKENVEIQGLHLVSSKQSIKTITLLSKLLLHLLSQLTEQYSLSLYVCLPTIVFSGIARGRDHQLYSLCFSFQHWCHMNGRDMNSFNKHLPGSYGAPGTVTRDTMVNKVLHGENWTLEGESRVSKHASSIICDGRPLKPEWVMRAHLVGFELFLKSSGWALDGAISNK